MSTINPAARAAQEQARREDGRFGNQQHGAPDGPLPTGAGADSGEESMSQLAARVAAASYELHRRQKAVDAKLPDASIGNAVDSATVRASTSTYLYEARVNAAGEVAEAVNGRPFYPEGEHRALRKAHGRSALVRGHREELQGLAGAYERQQGAVREQDEATFYRIVDADGGTLEHHHSARGAEIGLRRHPGASVQPPRFERDEYDAELREQYRVASTGVSSDTRDRFLDAAWDDERLRGRLDSYFANGGRIEREHPDDTPEDVARRIVGEHDWRQLDGDQEAEFAELVEQHLAGRA
ncbi:MAG: hypothetical protein ACTH0V_05205 [Microbacteriaceae bacterium]